MMKKQILSMMLLISTITIANAQTGNVGINTTTPQVTLDVTGVPSDPNKADGVITPRLAGAELKAKDTSYGVAQTGAIVYATSSAAPTTTKTVNVTAPGYYYFDGAVWQSFKGTATGDINIYTDNGTLTGNRTMTMAGKTLTMNNAGTSTVFSHNFNESRILNTGANRGSYSASAGSSLLDMYVDNASSAQLIASGTATSLEIGTGNATPINFGTNNTTQATITSVGDMGIATQTPTERLDVATGNVRVRDINTSAGASGDKYVVADANGVLKTVAAPTVTTAPMNVTNQTGNYTALATDDIILYTTSGAAPTLTLPTTGIPIGKRIYLSVVGSNSVNFNPAVREYANSSVYPGQGSILIYTGDATSPWSLISGY